MKLVSSIAFACFIAASSTVEAFAPALPINNVPASAASSTSLQMNIGAKDLSRKSRILSVIDSNPTAEEVQTQLLSDSTSSQIQKCNWKVRKTLIRQIAKQAQRYELDMPQGFGIPPTQEERERLEQEASVVYRAERKSAMEAAAAQLEANKKAKAAKAAAVPAPAPAAKAESAPAPAPAAAEAAPAPAAAGGAGGEITPKTIKELRDATGAGMMDCKKALIEAEGDQDAAAEILRKKGLGKADKKASRVAAEGKIAFALSGDKAVMVEVNCETDFVGKDATFLGYCDNVAKAALTVDGDNVDGLMEQSVDGGDSIETQRQALVAKIGENIQVRRMSTRGANGNVVGGYVHMNTIGVLVELEGGDAELCQDVAMHIAAMNPPFATPEEVPGDVLDNERRILSEQALESGKPPEIVEKMIEGRIRKYLEEICVVSQPFVKDSDKTVGKYLEEKGAKMVGFTRLVVGEGIEKKVDDFAAEVAAMSGQSATPEPVAA